MTVQRIPACAATPSPASDEQREVFSVLSEELRQKIDYLIYVLNGRPQTADLSWGRTHVFDSTSRLEVAMHSVFRRTISTNGHEVSEELCTQFNRLPEAFRNEVYSQIYHLMGAPQTNDSRWGEHHVFD
ncbi:MAG: hypothetical protein JSS61_01620, partial [Verrucomicrobia bacterium]|nr:hypothetical protein [Verrucomicrobiota bacterium]